jgi:hypothetical protein
MCTRNSAVMRLLVFYVEQLVSNPDYHLQVSIADVLTEQNIAAVRDLYLYLEMDKPPVAEAMLVYGCCALGSPLLKGGCNDHRCQSSRPRPPG